MQEQLSLMNLSVPPNKGKIRAGPIVRIRRQVLASRDGIVNEIKTKFPLTKRKIVNENETKTKISKYVKRKRKFQNI